jgi:hypothetical protein
MKSFRKLLLWIILRLHKKLSRLLTDKEVMTIRTPYSGDKVYMVFQGKRFWIRNPYTLEQLGFTLGQEKMMEMPEFQKLQDGGSIDLTFPEDKRMDMIKNVTQTQVPSIPVQASSTPKGILNYRKSA